MIFEFIENNFVAIVITVFLMLFTLTNNNFEKNTNRYFLVAAGCILVLIVEENWEAKLALYSSPIMMRTILSAIGYSLRPIIPYILFLIKNTYSKKQLVLVSTPIVFNVIVAFSALFCKASFWYTADNQFVREPLGYTPFIVAGIYVILLFVRVARNWRVGGFKETLIVSAIVMLAFCATCLESVFGFRFIQNPSMATSITFYYLFLHSSQSNRDLLTDALTRRRLFFDANKYHSKLTAIISLDINNLKLLNDQYGHIAGDEALVTVTNIIKRYMGHHASLYRTGGDEFMILCFKMSEQEVQKIIDAIRSDLKETEYRCAIGYATYSYLAEFESICHLADSRMYEDKRRTKG